MSRVRGLVVALVASLALHALGAVALRALGLGAPAGLPPLLVDLVDPVVARSSPVTEGASVAAVPSSPPDLSAAVTRPALPRVSSSKVPGPAGASEADLAPPADRFRPPPVTFPVSRVESTRPVERVPRLEAPAAPHRDAPGDDVPRMTDLLPPEPRSGEAPGSPQGTEVAPGGRSATEMMPGRGGSPSLAPEGSTPMPGDGGVLVAALPPGRGGATESSAVPAEYDGYVRALRQRIQDRLVYPEAAVRRRLQGTIEVEIVVDPGGRLASAQPVGERGAPLLGEAALHAIRQATPFPFPVGVTPRVLRIRLPVMFVLH